MGRLADKNILITGGNSGIGLAAAQEFYREGARVNAMSAFGGKADLAACPQDVRFWPKADIQVSCANAAFGSAILRRDEPSVAVLLLPRQFNFAVR